MLRDYIGDRDSGFLFQSDSGRPLSPRNISRDSLEKILFGRELKNSKGKVVESVKGVAGKQHMNEGYGFHSFRRFRVTHLRSLAIPEDILTFWMGHADKTITDRYSQMKQRIDLRKEQAEKVGLGFEIPAMEPEKEELEACSK
jgi:integrase